LAQGSHVGTSTAPGLLLRMVAAAAAAMLGPAVKVFGALLLWALGAGTASAANENHAPVPFSKLGDGDCMAPGSRPVRGRSRRDMSHGACRYHCQDHHCLGYSYAPCERICTIHGDPARLWSAPAHSGWSTVNGGGIISTSANRCGSACFVRMGPCPSGKVSSSGAEVAHAELGFGNNSFVGCPFPYAGFLELTCGLQGIAVVSGRCLRPCDPGVIIEGKFQVKYPPILHGRQTDASCPDGALGALTMACQDGEVEWIAGRCGYNCPPGSLKAGSGTLIYQGMTHEARTLMPCPSDPQPGWNGTAMLECVDSLVSVLSGRCDAHCSAGAVTLKVGDVDAKVLHSPLQHNQSASFPCGPTTNVTGSLMLVCNDGLVTFDNSSGGCKLHCNAGMIGEGVKARSHPAMKHGDSANLTCNSGFVGYFVIRCSDGVVQLEEGECNMNCVQGSITSNSMRLPYDFTPHGDNVTLVCPTSTHTGELFTTCKDGAMLVINGTCGENCLAGSVPSNGAYVDHAFMLHGNVTNYTCPAPYGSFLELRCYDGSVRVNGKCGKPCNAGSFVQNGAIVRYPSLDHETATNFTCSAYIPGSPLTFSGLILLECIDGEIYKRGKCYPDCGEGSVTSQGSRVLHPKLVTNEVATLPCTPSSDYGMVQVSCIRGLAEVTGGTCGQPCPEGEFSSSQTREDVLLPLIAHATDAWFDCAPQLSGRFHVKCNSGYLKVLSGTCGDRCPSQPLVVYGASFTTPLLEHEAPTYTQACMEPFSGIVTVTCRFGELNITSLCQKGCFAGNTTLATGATVFYPDLVSGGRITTTCPPEYAGTPELECVDGQPKVVSGDCLAHCQPGRFVGGGYELNHYLINHNATVIKPCDPGYVGELTLECLSGVVSLISGSCSANCVEGNQYVRAGVYMQHGPLEHGEMTASIACPQPQFIGSVRLGCNDGKIVLSEGNCFAHCGAGKIQGASYGGLAHTQEDELACEVQGEIQVKCFDGNVEVKGGVCIYDCPAGTMTDENGTSIQHGPISHMGNTTGTCTTGGTGSVTLTCNNEVVSLAPQSGERCFRHCTPELVSIEGGLTVTSPEINHGQRGFVPCPLGKLGAVTLRCMDSEILVIDGKCGDMNCAAGTVTFGAVELDHPPINDARQSEMPSSCPTGYIGEASFHCSNGTVTVADVTKVMPVSDSLSELGMENATFAPSLARDDERFLFCGCCWPPIVPPEPGLMKAPDERVILYWGVGMVGGGVILAGISGLWMARPEKFMGRQLRRPPSNAAVGGSSKVHPDQVVSAEETTDEIQVYKHPLEKPGDTAHRMKTGGDFRNW